ncbi:MAG: hypothetical protein P4K94_08265 [Terracidiphilus sp.]|nr:hypothetical protein [Terracidiphilus sp.]
MPDFQRLFLMSDPSALSLNDQAALGPVRAPERSQFSHLVRHFLERFFNHETASPDGDAKARLVLIACTTGLPGFMVALYLWPVYHSFFPIMQKHHEVWVPEPPPYWLQVNHHFFFVLYSFVVMGIATVFEWDLFFPDLLDLYVLRTLPIAETRVFLARVASIAVLILAVLFDANILAVLVLPAATDPPNLSRFLAGHLLAVAGSGLFAAAFILALQGLLLSVFGERLFRRLSLLAQGLSITVLLMLLLLFPVLSSAVPVFLKSGSSFALCFPPFWFLGIYQRLIEGPAALPIYDRLAQIGCAAMLLVAGLAILTYPLAYLRRTRQLVEGPGRRATRNWLNRSCDRLLHATVVRPPVRRAVFHFIGQTLLRVPRYRIYLVLYGGVGLSIVVAAILRFTVAHQIVRISISVDGMSAALGIVAFWTVAGLRMAFVSSGNRQGSWVFRIVQGRPPHFLSAMEQLLAAKIWVFLCAIAVTLGLCLASRAFAPPELLTWSATTAQILVASGMCLLLTDAFFLNVTMVAFTGEPARGQSNIAFTVLKYYTFFPLVAWLPPVLEPWIESSIQHFAIAAATIAAAHWVLRTHHRQIVREYTGMPGLEEDEEEFPMKLGLRY